MIHRDFWLKGGNFLLDEVLVAPDCSADNSWHGLSVVVVRLAGDCLRLACSFVGFLPGCPV